MWHDDEMTDKSCGGCDGCSDCQEDDVLCGCGQPATQKYNDGWLCTECFEEAQEDETVPISAWCTGCQQSFPSLKAGRDHKCEGRAA